MSNGTGDGEPKTNATVLTWVIITLCTNATIGVCTLAYCLIYNKDLNLAVFTAFVGIVNYILGVLSGMFIKSSPTATAPTPPNELPTPTGNLRVPEQTLETTQ